jgi:hypothetical protein
LLNGFRRILQKTYRKLRRLIKLQKSVIRGNVKDVQDYHRLNNLLTFSDFLDAQVELLSSHFKDHEGSPQNTGGSTQEILAQLEVDKVEGSKAVEEIFSCIDALGLPLTDQ